MIDDAELLRRYAEDRSEEAFAEIVRRHIGLVYGKALRTLGYDRHLAEDGTQIVFSLLARKAAALSRRPAVSSWLYVTTGFVAAKMVRTERRRRMREQQAEAMDPLSITHPPSADLNCLYPALDTAMGKLSGRDRTAVLLRFFEGMPYSEIAPALQLSEEEADWEWLLAVLQNPGQGACTETTPAQDNYFFVSAVDNGWYASGLIEVRQALPAVRGLADQLLAPMDFSIFYDNRAQTDCDVNAALPDPATGQMYGGFYVDQGPAPYHNGALYSDPRIAMYIGMGRHQMPGDVWWRTWRTPPPQRCATDPVPSNPGVGY